MSGRVVIVGASLGGVRTAVALRREGFEGEIVLIGDEPHEPYDRPPLSKQILMGKWGPEKLALLNETSHAELRAEWHLGSAAVALATDGTTHEVTLANGEVIQGDTVVVATGTRARRLPFTADSELVAVRTLDDTTELLARLERLKPGARVAVIGAGFIGAEVASALLARELVPVVFETQARPLNAVLGETAAQWLEGLPREFGVEVRVNQAIDDVVPSSAGITVVTTQGSEEFALGVLGVGALPNVEWLDGSPLTIDRGLVVDDSLLGAPGIYAVGDVAAFPFARAGRREVVRIEHWQIANDHATYVAQHVTGKTQTPFTTVPYFWSDQYGKKIQMLGHPSPADDIEMMQGSVEEGKWLAHYRCNGVLTGVLALNNARELMLSKPLLED
jgi:3-phenylpropionate/trans-cinnamate dioxygenase ferredoxin reductase subunit